MSFFILQVKAFRIQRKLKWFKEEKLRSIQIDDGKSPTLSQRRRYYHFWTRARRMIRKGFSRVCCFCCLPGSHMEHFCNNIKTDTTFENTLLKSAVGFICGVILSYLIFIFFTFQLNFSLSSATFFCTGMGLILTLGLAFSYIVRCIVLLLIPVFFSSRGRQALTAYAYILAITGPAKNTLNNMSVLTESLACAEEELQKAVSHLLEVIKQPFIALGKAIKDIMVTVRKIIDRLKTALLAIKRVVVTILKVLESAINWLGSVVNICNKKIGTPFQRCERVFDGAVTDCQAKLGPWFRWLCSIAYVSKAVCYIVKPLEYICKLIDFLGDMGENAIKLIKQRLSEFSNHMKTVFYVSVKFDHKFTFDTNQSRTPDEITAGIVTEIRKRTDKFIMLFDWMSFAFSFFFLLILLKVWHYRQKFLTSDRFDNHYITPYFRDLDIRRARMDQDTVLPLHPRERRKFITITSLKLVYNERLQLTKSVIFLGAWSLKMLIHLALDYSLYWVLAKIHYHGRFQSQMEVPNLITLRVEGTGAVADIYKSTVKAFTPFAGIHTLDAVPCLPVPIPPNMSRYYQILSLLILCWFMVIVEPYGLRLRHVVMSYYHPTRAIQRTVWLYNNILRSRGSFLKYARRQLRRKIKGNEGIEKITFMDRMKAVCPLLAIVLGTKNQESCLMCAKVVRSTDAEQLVRCQKPLCVGRYCLMCYADIKNVCTVCMEPVEYGDPSDMDEEKDSSDEDQGANRRTRPQKRQKKSKKMTKLKNNDDTDTGNDDSAKKDDDKSKKDFDGSKTKDDDSSRRDDDDEERAMLSSDTGASTDLSYTYQDIDFEDRKKDDDDLRRQQELKCMCPFSDVERQYHVQFATVQDFMFMDGYQGDDYHREPSSAHSSSEVYIPLRTIESDQPARRGITWDPVTLDNEGVRQRRKRKPRDRRPSRRMCHENFNPFRLITKCLTKVFSRKTNDERQAATELSRLVADDPFSPTSGETSTSDDGDVDASRNVAHFVQSEQLIARKREAARRGSAPELGTATQMDRGLYCRNKSPSYNRNPSPDAEMFLRNKRNTPAGECVPLREMNAAAVKSAYRYDAVGLESTPFADPPRDMATTGLSVPIKDVNVRENTVKYANERFEKHPKRKSQLNPPLDSCKAPAKVINKPRTRLTITTEKNIEHSNDHRDRRRLPEYRRNADYASKTSPTLGRKPRDEITDSVLLLQNYVDSCTDPGADDTSLDEGATTDSPRITTDCYDSPDHGKSWEYFDRLRPRESGSRARGRGGQSPTTNDSSPAIASDQPEWIRNTKPDHGVRKEVFRVPNPYPLSPAARNPPDPRSPPRRHTGPRPSTRREEINRKYTAAHKGIYDEIPVRCPKRMNRYSDTESD